MLAQARLQNVARLVRDILACTAVTLFLDNDISSSPSCTKQEGHKGLYPSSYEIPLPSLRRHPLLDLFALTTRASDQDALRGYGSRQLVGLLSLKQVRMLRDTATQSGLTQYLNSVELQWSNMNVRSLAVAPLERAAGGLGFLLCASTQPDAFLQGERRMLKQYLPIVAQRVEEVLCDACTLPISTQRHSIEERTRSHELCVSNSDTDEKQHLNDVQEQQTLVSMVSHDLRMPLTAIKGYAGLLQAYGSASQSEQNDTSTQVGLTPALQQHYLDVIMEQTQHMEVLVSDLLDVSRIQAGRLALHRTSVDIAQLCQRVAQVMQHRVDQQQVGRYSIRCILQTSSARVWADADRVQQVLTNLLENAIKYSPNGGPIEIQVRFQHTSCAITVRDWGIGISRQHQSSLFQLFRRGEHPMHITGFGLGLYISRKLVEAMDGSIILHSSENEGTRVTFILPAEAPNAVPPSLQMCSSSYVLE